MNKLEFNDIIFAETDYGVRSSGEYDISYSKDQVKSLYYFLQGVLNNMTNSKFDWKPLYKDTSLTFNKSCIDFKHNARIDHVPGGFSGCFNRDGTRVSSIIVYNTQEEFEDWLIKEMGRYDNK